MSILRDEVVKKRNVIFVVAAGNEGPALSTIDLPAVTPGLISVGAYQLPSMQASGYAMVEHVPEGPYTWSSRGPSYDGATVTVWAPGGAVAGVSPFALDRSVLGNGTSMASPYLCGAISLVLSALRAAGISWTPARVHHALRQSAKDVKDPQAVGLVQVEAFYNYLVEHKDRFECDADFDVYITHPGQEAPDFAKSPCEREGSRGVYLRETAETNRLYEASCHVRPSFATLEETEKLLKLDLKLALTCSAPWVQAPKHVSLPSSGKTFDIRVDPTSLPPGAHFAQIEAYDTLAGGRHVFTIPVCICKSESQMELASWRTSFRTHTGLLRRHFLAVPSGATQAEIRMSVTGLAKPIQIWKQCLQMQSQVAIDYDATLFVLDFSDSETVTKSIPVVGGLTMELCLVSRLGHRVSTSTDDSREPGTILEKYRASRYRPSSRISRLYIQYWQPDQHCRRV